MKTRKTSAVVTQLTVNWGKVVPYGQGEVSNVQTLPAKVTTNHDGVISLFNQHHTTRYMFVPMSHRVHLGHLAKPIPQHPEMQLHFL